MTRRIYVLLGKLGDVISFLPVVHHEIKQGNATTLMVSKDYADVLDGCSWLQPVIFDGAAHEIERAMEQARKLSPDVVCVQVAGPADQVKKYAFEPTGTPHATTGSFIKESWKLAGHMDLWKEQPPLVFDRRNKEREQALLKAVRGGDNRKPMLVANKGMTSPFPAADLLWELLYLRFRREYKMVNLSEVKAERFYDLLALYEKARCLVSIDSAPLHLAVACSRIPVIAITNDSPTLWHGSPWRRNVVFSSRYRDWSSRGIEMVNVIERLDNKASFCFAPRRKPSIVHVWNAYQFSKSDETWGREYESVHWIKTPAEKSVFGRDSRKISKESERFPFVKDLINMAALRATADDIICLTRPDIQFSEGLTPKILNNHPCWAHRTTTDEKGNETYHPNPELFAFTKKFWEMHGKELPELIAGNDGYWTRTVKEWLKLHDGKEIPFAIVRNGKASGAWKPITAHNEQVSKAWIASRNITPFVPRVSEQVPTTVINKRAVSQYGYNGSITRWKNRLLLAYRWHREGGLSTVLAMAQLDEQLNVRSNYGIEVPGKSIEDPRLFIHRDELWVSYVESTYPSMPPKCVQRYGKLIEGAKTWTIEGQFQVQYGRNDGQHTEKNWCFFSHKDRLFCIYETVPEQIVLEIEGYRVVSEYRSAVPHWKWGERKGGVMGGVLGGRLLRFWHSTLDNEPGQFHRRYYLGCELLQSEPPFAVVKCGSAPIARGSELDDLTTAEVSKCLQHKQKVLFPCGAIQNDKGFLVSCGINDCEIACLHLRESDLNL